MFTYFFKFFGWNSGSLSHFVLTLEDCFCFLLITLNIIHTLLVSFARRHLYFSWIAFGAVAFETMHTTICISSKSESCRLRSWWWFILWISWNSRPTSFFIRGLMEAIQLRVIISTWLPSNSGSPVDLVIVRLARKAWIISFTLGFLARANIMILWLIFP